MDRGDASPNGSRPHLSHRAGWMFLALLALVAVIDFMGGRL